MMNGSEFLNCLKCGDGLEESQVCIHCGFDNSTMTVIPNDYNINIVMSAVSFTCAQCKVEVKDAVCIPAQLINEENNYSLCFECVEEYMVAQGEFTIGWIKHKGMTPDKESANAQKESDGE